MSSLLGGPKASLNVSGQGKIWNPCWESSHDSFVHPVAKSLLTELSWLLPLCQYQKNEISHTQYNLLLSQMDNESFMLIEQKKKRYKYFQICTMMSITDIYDNSQNFLRKLIAITVILYIIYLSFCMFSVNSKWLRTGICLWKQVDG
jgi:hypothetical protein